MTGVGFEESNSPNKTCGRRNNNSNKSGATTNLRSYSTDHIRSIPLSSSDDDRENMTSTRTTTPQGRSHSYNLHQQYQQHENEFDSGTTATNNANNDIDNNRTTSSKMITTSEERQALFLSSSLSSSSPRRRRPNVPSALSFSHHSNNTNSNAAVFNYYNDVVTSSRSSSNSTTVVPPPPTSSSSLATSASSSTSLEESGSCIIDATTNIGDDDNSNNRDTTNVMTPFSSFLSSSPSSSSTTTIPNRTSLRHTLSTPLSSMLSTMLPNTSSIVQSTTMPASSSMPASSTTSTNGYSMMSARNRIRKHNDDGGIGSMEYDNHSDTLHVNHDTNNDSNHINFPDTNINNDIVDDDEKSIFLKRSNKYHSFYQIYYYCYYVYYYQYLIQGLRTVVSNNNNIGLCIAIIAWFTIGIISIVTTKLLLNTLHIPPLLLTTQQLILGSLILRMVLYIRGRDATNAAKHNNNGIQPWPWQQQHSAIPKSPTATNNSISTTHITITAVRNTVNGGGGLCDLHSINYNCNNGCNDETTDLHEKLLDNHSNDFQYRTNHATIKYTIYSMWNIFMMHRNFILAGIFFSMDFLFSNTAMQMSDASFVETVKASDPICTTTIALLFKVDKLSINEGWSLSLLVIGVLLSTFGNSKTSTTATNQRMLKSVSSSASYDGLKGSILTVITVTTANLCFAFRAMNQKRYRSKTASLLLASSSSCCDDATMTPTLTNQPQQMDDINLLCRMLQIGAIFLLIPTILLHGPTAIIHYYYTSSQSMTSTNVLQLSSLSSWEYLLSYIGLSAVNAISYATYNLASTFVLSKLTVLHHSSLNCLRRMGAILATSVYFNVPMTFEAILGLLTSFFGFGAFTYYRNVRLMTTTVPSATSATAAGTVSSTMTPTTTATPTPIAAANTSLVLPCKDSHV